MFLSLHLPLARMLNLTIIHLFFLFLANLHLILAYIPLPVTIKDSRIKLVPNLLSSSSFVYEDNAYLYGGFYTFLRDELISTTMYRFKFVEESTTLELSIVNSTNYGPKCNSCAIHPIPNTTKVYVLSHKEPFKVTNGSLPLLQPYVFDFSTFTWTNLTDTATYNGGARGNKAFEFRLRYSSVLVKKSLIYIIGGLVVRPGDTIKMIRCARSVIYYDTATNTFNVLNKDAPECRIDANSFITERSDEEIFTLFGDTNNDISYNFTEQNNTYGSADFPAPLASQDMYVLDTTLGDWSYVKPANNLEIPRARDGSTIQYDPSTFQVILFGGATDYGSEADLKSNDNVGYPNSVHYYNTISSTWTAVSNTDNPKGRACVSSVLLKRYNLMTSAMRVQEIDIFDLQTQKFLIKEAYKSRPNLAKAIQYGLVIVTIVGLVMSFAMAVIVAQRLHLINDARAALVHIVYERRNGEPVWTELSRLFAKLLCFIVFVLFIVYSYDNIVSSPIYSASDFKTAETLRYPDVRFCITSADDYEYLKKAVYTGELWCTVKGARMGSTGRSCTDKIYKIHDLSRHTPFLDEYYTGKVACYMLVTDENFTAVPDSPSILIGMPFMANLTNPLIHINVYDPDHNPNRYVFLNEPLPTGWTMEDIEFWHIEGDAFLQRSATYSSASLGDKLSIFFGKKTYKNLDPKAAGNYIGGSLFSVYDTTSNYTLAFDRVSTNTTAFASNFNIELNVASFEVETVTQKRANTLLGAFATAGGILGLLTTILALLFGSRPKSPWGLIHFTTRQTHRQNLSRALDSGEDDTLIPLVEPVGERLAEFDIQDGNEQVEYLTQHCDNMTRHMSRMESRIQMLETVLQSYYIDDEIFQSLKENRNKSASTNLPETNFIDSTTKETLTSDKESDKDLITESLLVENPNEAREQ